MLSISIVELLLMIAILPLLGGIIGYAVGGDRARRAGGEDRVAALQAEIDEYRGGVNTHFEQSAALMGQMAEQYRALYAHMARGSVQLCETAEHNPQLEAFQRLGLSFEGMPAADAEVEGADDRADGRT